MKRKNLLKTVLLILITLLAIIFTTNILATAETKNNQKETTDIIPITEIETNLEETTEQTYIDTTEMIIVSSQENADYQTIQQAIDNSPEKSIIFIKKGIYPEKITIKKPITLIGEDKTQTIINPISEPNGYAICIKTNDVTINDLTITNGGDGLYSMGIKITGSYNTINNCIIQDVPVGIAIWTSNNQIINSIFNNCKDEGIALLGTSFTNCNNNKITGCEFYQNCDAIELQYSSFNEISNCNIYDNTHSGIDAIASSNDNNTISNCQINNNEVHGIYLCRSSNNQIKNCIIQENKNGNIITTEGSINNEIINTIY